MIATKYRVPREKIAFILKKGDTKNSSLFIIKEVKNNEHFSRYRVIISRKISTKAVKRNKLRRQIYEAIRLNSKVEKEGYDRILIPKKRILGVNYREIEEDIKAKL